MIFVFVSASLFGQVTSTVTPDSSLPIKYSKLKIELDYSSSNTFIGRKDSINIPVITPYLKYTTKNRFFFTSSLVHSSETKLFFDELDLGAGKKFVFSDNCDGSISYTRYFFDSKVQRLRSTVVDYFSTYIGYDYKILYSRLSFGRSGGSTKNGKKKVTTPKSLNDYCFTLANSHTFYFDDVIKKDDEFYVSPEVDFQLSTQNFLVTYKGKKDAVYKEYQKQASKFSFTAITFYLDVSYQIKNFVFDFMPYYTIPMNSPTGENSSPYLVYTGSIYYTIKWK